jgi:hypothetical protein
MQKLPIAIFLLQATYRYAIHVYTFVSSNNRRRKKWDYLDAI